MCVSQWVVALVLGARGRLPVDHSVALELAPRVLGQRIEALVSGSARLVAARHGERNVVALEHIGDVDTEARRSHLDRRLDLLAIDGHLEVHDIDRVVARKDVVPLLSDLHRRQGKGNERRDVVVADR